MKKKLYSSIHFSHIQLDSIVQGHHGQDVVVGIDVGKKEVYVTVRWDANEFERPWVADNPRQIRELAAALARLGLNRRMKVAMESTGTYGDALRQALADAQIQVHLVSGKRAHDYAEVFDGVPSQHDGKDAAVVAELCAMGKSSVWPWQRGSDIEQQIELLVDQMQVMSLMKMQWVCRLEAMVARHWPEASGRLKLGSGTMLRMLSEYGGPAAMAADAQVRRRLLNWGRGKMSESRVDGIIESARETTGMRQSAVDVQRVKWCAGEALAKHLQLHQHRRRLQQLGKDHEVISRQGRAIGLASACVLWRHLGDPRRYHCGAAYRKAMGLNLSERSSGMYDGELKISKRGPGQVRRTLHLASLRLIRGKTKVRRWYERKLKTPGASKQSAITALSRKLAMALWSIVFHQQDFGVDQLLGKPGRPTGNPVKTPRKCAAAKREKQRKVQSRSGRKGEAMAAGT